MKILVLGGDNFQALRLVRDLGKRNHVCVAGFSKARSLASFSRYCEAHVDFNEFELNSMDSVLHYIQVNGVNLLIPTTERGCIIANEYRNIIESLECKVACSNMNQLMVAFNKRLTAEFCLMKDILSPKFFNEPDLDLKPQLLVRKPITSNRLDSDGTIQRTGSPAYYKSWNELPDFHSEYIVQEYIEGESIGYFALCKEGCVQTSYSHQRILDTNPSGSGSCVRKSILKPEDSLIKLSEKIIKNLKWDGPIMLEFLKDKNDRMYLLEINGRLWGSYCLATFSGIPFSEMLVSQYSTLEPISENKEDLKDIVVVNEILLISRWFQILKGKPLGASEKFPKRVSILRELKYLFYKREVLSDFDPLPLLRFLWKK